ncbi:MAG: T9SS type A sorting domain-containing protein [Saprospiraceae bacterium]
MMLDNAEWEVSVLSNGEIDLSAVPAGLYFLELTDGKRSITKRIIRQ